MLELNKENFDKEISKGKVVVDNWAEWCVEPKSTWILTGDNLVKSAQKISEKDTLLTYNGKSIVADKVKKSFTSNMFGHCKEVWTETNRMIKVTDEHQFLTPHGWKEATKLREGDKVAIMPLYTISNETFTLEETKLFDKKNIINSLPKEISKRNKNNFIKELKDKGLIPLKLNNKKLLILIRLLGFLFTDGNLYLGKNNNYREMSFSLGTKDDVDNITKDLKELGFNKYSIKRQKNEIKVNGRSYITDTKRVKICSTALWLLMKTLGAPVGDKTNTKYKIPKWLIKTNYWYLKKEFLAAYMGGDGPKIIMNLTSRNGKQPYNSLTLNDIEFHKNPEALDAGLKLARQLSKLFEYFNVKINKIFVEDDSYLKKDGKKSKIIHISFKQNFENAFNLYQNIGYRYAYTKDIESKYISEFIRRILNKRQNWVNKYQKAILLNKEKGYGYRKLSRILGLSCGTINGWLKRGVKPTINRHYEKYPRWLKQNIRGLSEGLMWEPIKQVKEIYLESVQKITMQNNHNFIANEFLVHNCGPCRAMAPVFEALSKEMKNVKFAKLNVDDNPGIASRYNIMSIPTFLIFKDGKPVKTLVGSIPKEKLKSEIEGT